MRAHVFYLTTCLAKNNLNFTIIKKKEANNSPKCRSTHNTECKFFPLICKKRF